MNALITRNPFEVWDIYAQERDKQLHLQPITFSKLLFFLDFFLDAYPLIVDGMLDEEDQAFFIEIAKKELQEQTNMLGGNYSREYDDPFEFDANDFLSEEAVNQSIEEVKYIANHFEKWNEYFLAAYAGLISSMVEFGQVRELMDSLSEDAKEELSFKLLLDRKIETPIENIIAHMLMFFSEQGDVENDTDVDKLMEFLYRNDAFQFGLSISNYDFQDVEDFQFSPIEIAKTLWLREIPDTIPHKLHPDHKKIVKEVLLRFGVNPDLAIEVFARL